MSQTSGMLAVGIEASRKGAYFIIQPEPSSRKTNLVSFEHAAIIIHQTFVTNDHLLIQFDGKQVPKRDLSGAIAEGKQVKDSPQTVIMAANGMIITQSEEV